MLKVKTEDSLVWTIKLQGITSKLKKGLDPPKEIEVSLFSFSFFMIKLTVNRNP